MLPLALSRKTLFAPIALLLIIAAMTGFLVFNHFTTARQTQGWVIHSHEVIEAAQSGTGARMIRVPDVRVAGIQVGPVWFTERPDRNFTVGMSGDMSGPVEGALGGNAYRDLSMTVDYPNGRAAFSKLR